MAVPFDRHGNPLGAFQIEGETDPSGRFRLDLEPEVHSLRVGLPGYELSGVAKRGVPLELEVAERCKHPGDDPVKRPVEEKRRRRGR